MQKNCSMKRQSVNNRSAHRAKNAPGCGRSAPALVRICVLMISLLFGAAPGHAACPSGAVSLYMPTPAGSQLDALYDLLPDAWGAHFSETLRLTPMPGRGGSYAVSRLLDDESDGCSLAAVIVPSVYFIAETTDRMYNATDLDIAAVLASAPNAIWVTEESPFRSLADLVIHARAENEKAGGVFILAGTGRYTDQHMASLEFDRAAGVKSLYLPVLGSAQAIQAVKNGQATACWGYALTPESMPGMRVLGVAGERRSSVLPEVPTFQELRVDMINVAHFALALRIKAPDEFGDMPAQPLRNALTTLMADSELRGRMAAKGFTPLALGPQEIGAFLEERRREAASGLAAYDLIPRQLWR